MADVNLAHPVAPQRGLFSCLGLFHPCPFFVLFHFSLPFSLTSAVSCLVSPTGTVNRCDQGRQFATKAMGLVSDSQKMQASGLRFEKQALNEEAEESEGEGEA